jgi:hypothetical protein
MAEQPRALRQLFVVAGLTGIVIQVLRGSWEYVMRRKGVPDCGYLFKTATHWRMRAEKMRALAEETHDPTVRAMMLRFAANYDRVAGQAADPARQDSIMLFRRAEVKPESRPSGRPPSRPRWP